MTHQCVRCGTLFPDEDPSILRGCSKCGSIFFLFISGPRDTKQINDMKKELEAKDTTLEREITKQIEKRNSEVRILEPEEEPEQKTPEIRLAKVQSGRKRSKFGIETLRIPREGLYEINIDALMKRKPLIIFEKGKVYLIHLPSAFEKGKN